VAGTCIMAEICTSPYAIEKVGNSPYLYPYPVNMEIFRQNGDEFEQYPWRQIYLPSLTIINVNKLIKEMVSCLVNK